MSVDMNADPEVAERRRHARYYALHSLTVNTDGRPGGPAVVRGSRSALEFYDASNECVHGRIAGDRTEPCGCWPQEKPPTPDLMTIMHHTQTRIERTDILAAARELGEFSPAQLADHLGASRESIRKRLADLVSDGALEAEGSTRDRRYRLRSPSGETPVTVSEPTPVEPVSTREAIAAERREDSIIGALRAIEEELAGLDARRERLVLAATTLKEIA